MITDKKIIFIAALLSFTMTSLNAQVLKPDSTKLIYGSFFWRIGINNPEVGEMLETVAKAKYKGRSVWRVVHHDTDPTEKVSVNAFDLYDLDMETLQPLRSVMSGENFYFEILFSTGKAILYKKNQDGTEVREEITLDAPLLAEGPGASMLMSHLPLKKGFTTKGLTLDRWRGKAQERVRKTTITVMGQKKIKLSTGTEVDVFQVERAADDKSSKVVSYCRTSFPHWEVRVEYFFDLTKPPMISEVVAIAE